MIIVLIIIIHHHLLYHYRHYSHCLRHHHQQLSILMISDTIKDVKNEKEQQVREKKLTFLVLLVHNLSWEKLE